MFASEADLEAALSEPTPEAVAALGRSPGDVVLLGAGGKMGLSLARMARRAADLAGGARRVVAASRFGGGGEEAFRAAGVEPIRCDLFDERAVAALPDAANVVYMPGLKFGAAGNEAAVWATNSFLPGVVCRRYRGSRIVAFSTGNVYGLTPAAGGGSRETDVPRPDGEYAMSALGRERVFEFFARADGTPVSVVRLNYACDLRYGVLVDLAQKVLAGEPIDLGMGYFNTVWQGDANALTLAAFDRAASPPWVVNVSGPETLSVRAVAERFGQLLGKPVRFTGTEAATALLCDTTRCREALGSPRVAADPLVEWVAGWVGRGGATLGKPTRFEVRDGTY
jgi:nucleoside-diphosphate-sugar epimerase